ncbi:MAG: hypothetical protein U0228_07290 [Myxococcaceae bacterium]
MKRFAWVFLASGLIALGAFLLVRWLEADTGAPLAPPPPPPPLATPAPAKPPFFAAGLETEAPRPPPPPVAPKKDAGVPRDVRLHVMKQGKTAVGERITLACGVSGVVDQMGDLVLPVPEGGCDVISPERVEPSFVASSSPEQTMEILEPLSISGRVADAQGNPVPAFVTAGKVSVRADLQGRFELRVPSPDKVEVFAELLTQRSRSHFVAAPSRDLLLVVEPVYDVTLLTGTTTARVVATSTWSTLTCNSTPCTVRVPAGELRVRALAVVRGRLLTDSLTEVISAPTKLELVLRPAPPLKGRVVTTTGQAVRGVRVSAKSINPTAEELTDQGLSPATVMELSSTLTNTDGRFVLPWPPMTNSLFYLLQVDAPKKLQHRALVTPGDGAVELVVAE